MPRGTKIVITLTDHERQTLVMWTSAPEKRYVQRAQVILSSAEGISLPAISKKSGLSRQNCSRWRMRFLEEGLEGLKDLPRKGRPPINVSEIKPTVDKFTRVKHPQRKNRWTRRSLAKAVVIGKTTAHRIPSQTEPHKAESWSGKSTDPEFVENQVAILGIYLNPLRNGLVLCVNDKPQTQISDQTQPEFPFQPGNPKNLDITHMRNDTTSLLAALSNHNGSASNRYANEGNRILFLNFLKRLYRSSPRKHLHIITDGISLVQHKDSMNWIQRRKRLAIYFTPTHASWLSQIEILINIFTRDVITGGPWRSKERMIDQIMYYIRRYSSKRIHPFSWIGKPFRES